MVGLSLELPQSPCLFYSQRSQVTESLETCNTGVGPDCFTNVNTDPANTSTLISFSSLRMIVRMRFFSSLLRECTRSSMDPEILVCVVAAGWEHGLGWYSGQRRWVEGTGTEMLTFFFLLLCPPQMPVGRDRAWTFKVWLIYRAISLKSQRTNIPNPAFFLLSPAIRLYRVRTKVVNHPKV